MSLHTLQLARDELAARELILTRREALLRACALSLGRSRKLLADEISMFKGLEATASGLLPTTTTTLPLVESESSSIATSSGGGGNKRLVEAAVSVARGDGGGAVSLLLSLVSPEQTSLVPPVPVRILEPPTCCEDWTLLGAEGPADAPSTTQSPITLSPIQTHFVTATTPTTQANSATQQAFTTNSATQQAFTTNSATQQAFTTNSAPGYMTKVEFYRRIKKEVESEGRVSTR